MSAYPQLSNPLIYKALAPLERVVQNYIVMKRQGKGQANRPKDAAEAAEFARRYVRDLFGGEEPDHAQITTTLFLAAFESVRKIPDLDRRRAVLRRAYERADEEAGE